MRYSFDAIGTSWQVDIPEHPELFADITDRIAEYDRVFSRFRADSVVSQIARQAGRYTLPPEAEPLFSLYHQLYELTSGVFTPLIGSTLSEAGYDADYSLIPGTLQSPPEWNTVLSFAHPELETKQPVLLDIGAAGKGQLIDIVAALIENAGISEYVVDAGGDIRCRGAQALRVGLEHPSQPESVVGVAQVNNLSICGSAGNRRKWGKYHHILNPKTLESPSDVAAAWVIADTTMLADALSTCLFFTTPQELLQHFPFSYAVLYYDHSISYSSGFPGEIFA